MRTLSSRHNTPKNKTLILCHGRRHPQHTMTKCIDWDKSFMIDKSDLSEPDLLLDLNQGFNVNQKYDMIIAMHCPYHVLTKTRDSAIPNDLLFNSIAKSLNKNGVFLGPIPTNGLKILAKEYGYILSKDDKPFWQKLFLLSVQQCTGNKLMIAQPEVSKKFIDVYPHFSCMIKK